MAKPLIEPRILKGFRDTTPSLGIVRQRMIRKLEEVFSTFGFVPIDTPALEYADILLGKGSEETDKQLYRFQDNGGRDVALRFDLTVPLARFAAMHVNELGTPFRRYHIAPVWRAEKPQRGRYREFIQCDFDIIGTESVLADAEILSVINTCFRSLGIGHLIRVNNRKVLNGLLQLIGAHDKTTPVLRAVDKLEKLGRETVEAELKEQAQLDSSQCAMVFNYVDLSQKTQSNQELLTELKGFLKGSELGLLGVSQLERLAGAAHAYGIEPSQMKIDLSIARGLDYYTGTVYETALVDLPEIGSICSGGRYDDLASLYINRKLPGVGASVGLDRILGALEALERLEKRDSTAAVLVTVLDESAAPQAMSAAAALRASGISAELYPEAGQLGAQLKYADRKNISLAVLIGQKEVETGACSVKDLRSKTQINDIPFADVARRVSELLKP